MHIPVVTALDIQAIRDLVGDRLGLSFSATKYQCLKETVHSELERLELSFVSDYLTLLETETLEGDLWQRLVNALANPESYFFREQSQFELLHTQILPELIQRRSPHRQLKIWSAGCATGEEVYSLAILLTELIPDIEEWDITIIGTDINTEALVIAAAGEYREWSWRLPETVLRDKYFQSENQQYQISEALRRLVTFIPANLLDANLPTALQNVDLVLCRHVFIHLESTAINKILHRFQDILAIDGYLMTGHGELYGMALQEFRAQVFSGSFVYQRELQPQSKGAVLSLPCLNPEKRSPATPKRQLRLSDPIFAREHSDHAQPHQSPVAKLIHHHRYHQAIALLEKQLGQTPTDELFQAHYTLACLHARLGQYPPAEHHCQQAMEWNHMSELPSYLLAQMAIAQGNYGEAKDILHKILFFNGKSALAYYELAQIHYREQDGDRAQFFETKAWQHLQELDPSHLIDPFQRRTVKQLCEEMNSHLALSS